MEYSDFKFSNIELLDEMNAHMSEIIKESEKYNGRVFMPVFKKLIAYKAILMFLGSDDENGKKISQGDLLKNVEAADHWLNAVAMETLNDAEVAKKEDKDGK